MKYCPVCKIEYSDNAEFCKKCEAHLLDKADVPEKIPTDYKRIIRMCLYTGGFIVFIMALWFVYYLIAG